MWTPRVADAVVHDRVVGLDVARCLALLGMVATHVLADREPGGDLALGQAVAGGRAAALFAVLAGVSIALMSGGRRPVTGRGRVAVSAGLAVRALLVALLGLVLGETGSGLAVILTYYGLLFLLALPFLGLGAPALLWLAAGWTVAVPVVSHLVRPGLPPRGVASPTLGQLADPGGLLSELTFTGYYPAVPWLAYLLVGLAVGRLDLRDRFRQGLLAVAGGAAALTATLVSDALTRRPAVSGALLSDPPADERDVGALLDRISTGMFGNVPTGGAWEWLLVRAPHSTTPFDLAQTVGSALVVIGLALLVVDALPAVARHAVRVFFGAGRMTLTLYSLHVLMRTPDVWPPETPDTFRWHVLVLLGIGAGYAAVGVRGPLEQLVASASSAVARRVRAGARG